MALESDLSAYCVSCGKTVSQCQCATVRVEMDEALAAKLCQSLNEGDIEGRYRILEKVGVGGMGTVYRAEHVVLNKQLAVKVLRTELLNDNNAMARFEQESRACAALAHPNLVSVFDCGINQLGQPYLVMEFLSGNSLNEIVKESGALPLAKFFPIFIEAADGLAYAHEHGVIHRDLKPSNILVSADPRGGEITKIVDFGVAKIEDLGGEFQMLTRTGEVFGSPAYMSPEQCRGNQVDQRSDIYALGCVMYEALSGRQAFKGANIITIMNKQVEMVPPPPARLDGKNTPVELQNLVMKCLEKDPDSRYQTMRDLHQDLKKAQEKTLLNQPLQFGPLRLPSGTVPVLVSLAVLSSLVAYPALMPGGSLRGLAPTVKSAPTSKLMLAAYCQRKHMYDYSSEILLPLLTGPESKNLSVTDRSQIAVIVFDQIYNHTGGKRRVLELFGKSVSEILDDIEHSAKQDPRSVASAAWSAPLLYYYAGGAQENEENFTDAQSKYRHGLALANLLDAPKWVKAKLNEELGELYMGLEEPHPQDAIAPLKEARRLLLAERKTIREELQEPLSDTTNLLFDALEQSKKTDEAVSLMESYILYLQAQDKVSSKHIVGSMKKLIEFYARSNNQEQVRHWQLERGKFETAKADDHSLSPVNDAAPYTVQMLRALNAKTDQFAINEIFERFNNALTTAEKKHAPDLDRVAIGAAALEVCSDYWLDKQAEQIYSRISPALERLQMKMQAKREGEFFDAGHSALALHYLARAEYLKQSFDKARTYIELAKPFCQRQPDGDWIAGRLDVLEAKTLVAQNKDLDQAERAAVSGIQRLANQGERKNYRLADAYWALATVHKQKKQYKAARNAINTAIAIVTNSPGNDWHINAEYLPELQAIEAAEKRSK